MKSFFFFSAHSLEHARFDNETVQMLQRLDLSNYFYIHCPPTHRCPVFRSIRARGDSGFSNLPCPIVEQACSFHSILIPSVCYFFFLTILPLSVLHARMITSSLFPDIRPIFFPVEIFSGLSLGPISVRYSPSPSEVQSSHAMSFTDSPPPCNVLLAGSSGLLPFPPYPLAWCYLIPTARHLRFYFFFYGSGGVFASESLFCSQYSLYPLLGRHARVHDPHVFFPCQTLCTFTLRRRILFSSVFAVGSYKFPSKKPTRLLSQSAFRNESRTLSFSPHYL